MQQFATNAFLMDSINFLILLGVLVAVFHLMLVWPRNLSKKNWKRIDYIWLGAAAMGVISLAADVRISVANNWLEMEKVRAVGILDSIRYLAQEPESSHFCMTFVKSEYSPKDFDNKQNEYRIGCEWRKELSKKLSVINSEETPPLKYEDLPPVLFDDPILNETVIWLKDRLNDYKVQLKILSETKSAAEKTGWESTLAYFAPFLICIALALRITKVSGEVRHET